IKHGTVEGLVGALGAGAGVTASEPRAIFSSHPARIENSLIKSDVRAQAPKLVEKPSLAILEVAGRPMKAVGIDVFPNVGQSKITLNAMAPLLVGVDPANPLGSSSRPHWQAFERDLVAAKKLGIEGISTDVWWGMIEPRPGKFDWRYYDHLSTTIQKHGLKWVPILSLHQAGGNVGDNVNIPIPLWVWNKAGSRVPSRNPDAVKFVSEQGNKSHEYVSYWGTPYIIDRKANVMKEFQSHFAGKAHSISELNISLGTAGEIRYPSYNSHDQGSGYPTRGALQAYSELAKASFRNYSIKKYGSVEAVKEAWGPEFKDGIGPPREPQSFFDQGKHLNTRYGRDFFDWYSDSLLNHGRLMLGTAVDVFGAKGAPFAGIDIGAKMPGVHWRVGSKEGDQIVLGDRLAELSAGLIRTSRGDYGSDAMGRGYRPLMQMFAEVQAKSPYSRIVPHFTALEMMDGHEGPT
ncbi:MAG: family 14 glycosylhydrolase, partial [Candidatus Obscuribacterales bacterium]|nr:family 14 glycosylhydrolase [Candidatus Obscuribacterales bacterium]